MTFEGGDISDDEANSWDDEVTDSDEDGAEYYDEEVDDKEALSLTKKFILEEKK